MATSLNFVSMPEVIASLAALEAKEACYTQEATKELIEQALARPREPRWCRLVISDAVELGALRNHAENIGSTLLYLEDTNVIVYCAQ